MVRGGRDQSAAPNVVTRALLQQGDPLALDQVRRLETHHVRPAGHRPARRSSVPFHCNVCWPAGSSPSTSVRTRSPRRAVDPQGHPARPRQVERQLRRRVERVRHRVVQQPSRVSSNAGVAAGRPSMATAWFSASRAVQLAQRDARDRRRHHPEGHRRQHALAADAALAHAEQRRVDGARLRATAPVTCRPGSPADRRGCMATGSTAAPFQRSGTLRPWIWPSPAIVSSTANVLPTPPISPTCTQISLRAAGAGDGEVLAHLVRS